MKIFVHILLLYFSLGACLPKGDFSQLLKFNDLQEHYVLHQNEAVAAGTGISFSKFLYLHFIDGGEHQHENENNHNNLPFQNITSSITCYIAPCPVAFVHLSIVTESMLPSYNTLLPEGIAFDIFHPPSIV